MTDVLKIVLTFITCSFRPPGPRPPAHPQGSAMRTAPALDQATHDWVTRSLARARYRGSHP